MAKTFKRYVRRQVRRGKRYLRRRYVTKKGNFRVGQLVSDVRRLKALINVEKKDYSGSEATLNFALTDTAQTLQRGDCLYKLEGPTQGTSATTRTGNSVKLTSINFSMRIQGQASLVDTRNYAIYFLQYVGVPDPAKDGTAGSASYDNLLVLDFMEYNASKISEMCFRTKETYRNWRILKVIKGRLAADQTTSTGDAFRVYNFWVKPHRGMEHMKFDGTDQDPLQNPIYILFTSTGGATNSSTGLRAEFYYRINYVDN